MDLPLVEKNKRKLASDFLLKSFGVGQYSFCYMNNYGNEDKVVEIIIEKERPITNDNIAAEDLLAYNSIEEIDRSLDKISKLLQYLRAREWRNMHTVNSTKSRLRWLAFLGIGVTVAVSILQAVIIEFFFKGRSSNYV